MTLPTTTNERTEPVESTDRGNSRAVERQLAIFDVAKQGRGKRVPEIRRLLRGEFRRRGLPQQPDLWVDAVATEASYGKPYILDFEVAAQADKVSPVPDERIRKMVHERPHPEPAEAAPGAGGRQIQVPPPGDEHREQLLGYLAVASVVAVFLLGLGVVAASESLLRRRR